MIEIGDRDVKDMRIGESVIYRDSYGWIPLSLPTGVTGSAFFRDNRDGTASLSGVLSFVLPKDKSPVVLLTPPEGYEFTSSSWNANNNVPSNYHGIVGANELDGRYLMTGDTDVFDTAIADGNIKVLSPNYSTPNGQWISTVFLSKSSTVYLSKDAGPAIVNIEKV